MKTNIIQINHTCGNATEEIIQAIGKIQPDVENIIQFEKGIYHFYRTGCYHDTFYPSNNASGEKDVVFPILDVDNLTIDGNGSEFIFCDRIFPFILQNSRNIKIKNFSIDFSFQRYIQAVVVESDEKGLGVLIDKESCDYDIKDGHMIVHLGSDDISTADRRMFIINKSYNMWGAFLYVGDCQHLIHHRPAPTMFVDLLPREGGVYFKLRKGSEYLTYEKGSILVLSNDEGRENGIFFLEYCSDVLFENINIYRGAGMGIMAQMSENITVDGVNIMPKPSRNDIVAITADTTHFLHCTGTITVRNCNFVSVLDDVTDVHGVYGICKEVLADDSISIRYGYQSQNGLIPYKAGDRIIVVDGETTNDIYQATIKTVSHSEKRENIVLTFTENIKDIIKAGDFIENPDRSPKVVMENNVFRNLPALRLCSPRRTEIKNNVFENTGILFLDHLELWHESGVSNDAVVSGNEFKGRASISIGSVRKAENTKMHGRICIEGNSFELPENQAISASHVKELILQDNLFGKVE